MGVSSKHLEHNHGNMTLMEGARKLGFEAKPVPQNTAGCDHDDGYCGTGCGMGIKQGPANCWFPEAAKFGAEFMEGFHAEKVLFRNVNGKRVARGVLGTWTPKPRNGMSDKSPQKLFIKAERVVVCAGSLWSPVILKKSGLKVSIKRRLH